MTDVTRALADFASELTLADVPAASVDRVRDAVVDSVGCALFGRDLPWVEATRAFAAELGGANGGAAAVWGTGMLLPAANAAMVNGTATHSFELDDLHASGVIHPGAEIIPAVLALAEREGASGARALEAICAGYEVGCRVGAATGPEQLRRGWHPSATSGAVGAAAGAARLLRLDRERTLHAIAIGATQASGLMSAQYGATVKRWHLGRSAQAGVYAALMAAHGLTGARQALEAPYGGFVAAFAPDSDAEAIARGLGERWEIDRVGFKVHSCCGSSQTAVEAVLRLAREHELQADEVAEVEAALSTSSFLHVGWPYAPESVTTAQMNLSYAVAAALVDGAVFVDQFRPERLDDPRLLDVVGRVRCRADEEIDALGPDLRHTARVTIRVRGGEELRAEVRHRPGSDGAPVATERLQEKFHRLVGGAVEGAETLRRRLWSLEQEERLDGVIALMAGERNDTGGEVVLT